MPTAPAPQGPRPDPYGPVGRSAWLDVDWRAHQRWVPLDGRRVNVIELGSGPAMLFIHGLSGCWQNWLENLPHFARSHRVLALDLPGFGASELPADGISIAGYARVVDRLLAELGVERATIVGNSMGGFIGAELALAFPRRVERLVLVSAAGMSIDRFQRDRLLGLARATQGWGRWVTTNADGILRRPGYRRWLLGIVFAHPERLPAALCREQLHGTGKEGFLSALEDLTRHDLRARVPEIDRPTLIVWGDRDLLVPVRDADRWAQLLPDARALIYRDTGHCAMLERPARFNADVDAFLAAGEAAAAA